MKVAEGDFVVHLDEPDRVGNVLAIDLDAYGSELALVYFLELRNSRTFYASNLVPADYSPKPTNASS